MEYSLMSSSDNVNNCMTHDLLRDISFSTFLRRVASLLLSGASMSDPMVDGQVTYAVFFLWEIFRKSNSSLKQTFMRYIAGEPCLIVYTLEAMYTYMESYCEFINRTLRCVTTLQFHMHYYSTWCSIVLALYLHATHCMNCATPPP
jgi:hypothetical protein